MPGLWLALVLAASGRTDGQTRIGSLPSAEIDYKALTGRKAVVFNPSQHNQQPKGKAEGRRECRKGCAARKGESEASM